MGRKADRAHSGAGDDLGFTPKRAKNAVRVAKVVVPAAVPALAPLVLRAAGAVREVYDRRQARRMGIDVTQLPEYSGRGGALLARLAGASNALTQLADSERATDADREFVARSRSTLEQLTASVRAAEHMPVSRRKAAHRAVGAELDLIEVEVLRRLGVPGAPS
ncbi:DUF6474 family protein [Saccharomonospora azurea]|uniref:Uncharacterized protein n=1 Tax=Saccharomonospora azurea NA-128 TaxID=882081 RepID=H8GBS9_9PSEU|nr:DUF6474 family protein [Saccharomonospora azurea]EHK88987.1 hypothetical protein SZMC14600_02694 [Saccharomonospora azurea SZMC 14600]EHY89732.1 hypothetical protein SacazDRAFT_02844 [Saccharomonospora azurea NA-128]